MLNGHGAPTHNFAINEACDFVSETFQVTMLHVTGLLRADPSIQAAGQKVNSNYFSASQLSALGLDIHGGVGETSGTLAIRRTSSAPSTESSRAAWAGPSKSCSRSRPHPDGKGISGIPPRPAPRTAEPSRPGGLRVRRTDPARCPWREHARPPALSRTRFRRRWSA